MYYRALMKSYEFLVLITHVLNATTIQPFLSVFQFYAPVVTQENQIMQLLSARARITGQDSMSDTSACNPGYAMVGPAVRRCLVGGKWSGNVPTCKT